MTIDRVRYIEQLLDRMRAEDPGLRVFGSERHRYLLGPTLTETQLRAFELAHRIWLPEEYRLFLNEAGDGGGVRNWMSVVGGNAGAGPGYSLQPLDEAVLDYAPGVPFPLTESSEAQPAEGMERWGDADPFPRRPCARLSGIG